MAERFDTRLSRRRFLTASGGLGATLLSFARGASAAPPHQHTPEAAPVASGPTPAPAGGAGLLVEPEVRRAVNGELRTTLRARYAYKESVATSSTCGRTRGRSPVPRCACRSGDALAIRLINDLPPNRDVMPQNTVLPAPLQYDELSFSRLARESGRNRRQRHAQHGAREELRRRDRVSPATIPAAPTGITRIITAGPTSRWPVGWWAR